MAELVEVRCPRKILSKQAKYEYVCNKLCVSVKPGSSGQAYCSKCKASFEFEVMGDRQSLALPPKSAE